MVRYSRVKGTLDLLPEVSNKWQEIEALFRRVCRNYGYGEIRIPTFEYTEVFNRGVGETTDVVQKEMYTFADRGGRYLTLRPEATAGVVRAFIENGLQNQPLPQRLYYTVSAFRAENVQKGRYREFHQLGVECLGADTAAIDVEIISLIDMFFKQAGLQNYQIRLNSLGSKVGREQFHAALLAYLEPQGANLCSDCQTRLQKNPLRVLDCKVPTCKEIVAAAPAILTCLPESDVARFNEVLAGLDNLNIAYEVDSKIVRGLDYYCHTVFEFVLQDSTGGQAGTICGGGRYDGLVALLGGNDQAGVGFSIGMERLMLALESQGRAFAEERPTLFIVAQTAEEKALAAKLLWHLRQAGIWAEQDLAERSFKAQMKYLNKRNFAYALVLGEREVENLEAKLKDLDLGAELADSFSLADFTQVTAFLKSKVQ